MRPVEVREPTPDEYVVYSSLVRHIADDDLFAKKKLTVINQTSRLSLPNYDLLAPYQPPTPLDRLVPSVMPFTQLTPGLRDPDQRQVFSRPPLAPIRSHEFRCDIRHCPLLE
jgi:hypothetical protein